MTSWLEELPEFALGSHAIDIKHDGELGNKLVISNGQTDRWTSGQCRIMIGQK